MNKKLLFLPIFALILVAFSLTVSAHFTKSHEIWVIKGFEQLSSGDAAYICKDKLAIVLDGNTGADVPVLHYFDEGVAAYISTHTTGSGYKACLDAAGSDIDKRCMCVGIGTHITQDAHSHTDETTIDGLVPAHLKKFFGINFLGHMVIERNFENKHLKLLENDPIITSGKLELYDSKVLDSFFPDVGGDYKYFNLFSDMSGIDIRNDAVLFRGGYQGKGFYDTVYKKEKAKLPFWMQAIAYGMAIAGLIFSVIFIFFARSKWLWRIIGSLQWIIILVVGVLLIVSFYQGTTWKITTTFIEIPAKLGYLAVSNDVVVQQNEVVQRATNEFLRSGVINPRFQDATGLSYVDSLGNQKRGAITESEGGAKIVYQLVLPAIFAVLSAFVAIKAGVFGRKKR